VRKAKDLKQGQGKLEPSLVPFFRVIYLNLK
jgi:hypothetical protein